MSSRRVMTFHNLQRIPEIGRCVQQFQNPAPIVARYLKPSYGQYPFEITTRRGHHAMLNDWMDLTTAWAIFCRQEYSVPRASRTIIDLGANCGLFAIHAAERALGARILSVEPFGDTFTRLVRAIEENRLSDRVCCLQAAGAAESGRRTF